METMFFFSSQVFPQKHGFSTVFWGYVQYLRSTPYFWRRIRIQREKIQKKSIVSIPEPTVFFCGPVLLMRHVVRYTCNYV